MNDRYWALVIWASLSLLVLVGCSGAGPMRVEPTEVSAPDASATDPAKAAAAQVELVVDESTVRLEDTIELRVRIRGAESVYGLDLRLSYDPAVLEVLDADTHAEGIQIAHGGFLSPDFVAENSVDASRGTISYAISQSAPAEGRSGTGMLATISLRARAKGSSTFVIQSAALSDADGNALAVTWSDSTLTVE